MPRRDMTPKEVRLSAERSKLRDLAKRALAMLGKADATHRWIRGYGVVDESDAKKLFDDAKALGVWP